MNSERDQSILAATRRKYRTTVENLRLGQTGLDLVALSDRDPIIQAALKEAEAGEKDLPFWTKLWPASLLFARFVAGLKPRTGALMVELGCGRGLVGLAGAGAGHRVILTDLDSRALELARASAIINGLADRAEFLVLDWHHPCLSRKVDAFVGCEILYRSQDYEALASLFRTYLAPGGHVYLAHSRRPFTIGFFELIQPEFQIRHREFRVKSEDGDEHVSLYDIQFAAGQPGRGMH